MSGFVNRIKSWVTGDDYEEDVYQIDEEFQPAPPAYRQAHTANTAGAHEEDLMDRTAPTHRRHQKSLRVVDAAPAAPQYTTQMIVLEPKAFEESLEIVEHLRAKKSVILNLHLLDNLQSQRVVDFLSGATHAIDGNQQRIGDGVFIFTPNNVNIATEQPKPMEFNTDAFWRQAQ